VSEQAADMVPEQMHARILEWEDCYDRLAGAFDLHMDILECKQALADYAGVFYDVLMGDLSLQVTALESQLGTALAEIARLEAALRQVATMKTIIGARRIVKDALNEKEQQT
jgi:hypothetical protein